MRRCLIHKWRLYEFSYYRDVSYGGDAPSTDYTLACDRCAKTKHGFLYDQRPTPEMLAHRFKGVSKFATAEESR